MSDALNFELTVGWPEQKAARLESGDKLSEPREILYFAYFKGASKKAVPEVQSKLTEGGFQVSVRTKLIGPTSLIASKTHALTDDELMTHLKQVVELVESAGGEYDGFVGEVIA